MKYALVYIGIIGICMSGCMGKQTQEDLFDKEKLVAWCIVPFDANERSPEQRAAMLTELGLSALAYDYRDSHIPTFPDEIEVLKAYNIDLRAVWLWVDPRQEDKLGKAGRSIFHILKSSGSQTEIWMGMPEDAFEGLSEEESLALATEAVGEILAEADKIGCSLALYNHGGWYGEPVNLVNIIEELGSDKLRIVYNFHHGHHQIDRFQAYLELMLPYLSTINLNGMRVQGPKIIPLGEGDRELEMLRIIQASGYSGSVGIIGHTDGEDIGPVLERNLQGLEKLKNQLRK